MLRYVSIAKLLVMFEMEFFSAKPSEPMLRLKFYRGSCLGYLNSSYTTDTIDKILQDREGRRIKQ